jgi:DNA-binding MarR family transcriptional regulator
MKAVTSELAAAHAACAAGTLRRASRSLTRLYDAHLARVGLTTMQFSILRMVQRRAGRIALADLADDLAFERTSLYRALRRAGLVSIRPCADRRAREAVLTSRATRRIAAAMPHWAAAQRLVLSRLGAAEWSDLAGRIGHLTSIARQPDSE